MVFILLFLYIVVVVLLDHFLRLKRNSWINQYHGPSFTLPIVGNALLFVGNISRTLIRSSDAARHLSCFTKYGSTWREWVFTLPVLLTRDPELVKEMLCGQKHLEKPFFYKKVIGFILGDHGLIASKVNNWKSDRKLWNKVFNPNFLELSFQKSVECWFRTKQELLASNGNPVNCLVQLKEHFLATFLAFDIENSMNLESKIKPLGKSISKSLELINIRTRNPFTWNSILWSILGYQSKVNSIRKVSTPLVGQIIANFANDKQSANNSKHDKNGGTGKERLALQKLMTDDTKSIQWKYDHIVTLLGAGTDTTAIAATMTLFYLALNDECLSKVQSEVDLLFEEKGITCETFELDHLHELKYLRACIKESMRLHPPVPVIGRKTTHDISLADGRWIPKGTAISISIHQMNLNPEVFTNPTQFDPERFDEVNQSCLQTWSFIPFSGGPRNCVGNLSDALSPLTGMPENKTYGILYYTGQKYAEYVLMPLLALVLRNFDISVQSKAEEIGILYEVAGTPFPNVEITFRERATKHSEILRQNLDGVKRQSDNNS